MAEMPTTPCKIRKWSVSNIDSEAWSQEKNFYISVNQNKLKSDVRLLELLEVFSNTVWLRGYIFLAILFFFYEIQSIIMIFFKKTYPLAPTSLINDWSPP